MSWVRCLLVGVAVVSLPLAGLAHIVVEAPWHPLAHAYRSAVFLINLRPTDWGLVERAFTASEAPGAVGAPAKEQLIELDAATGSGHWPAIEQAIAAQDRDALFAAATRAVSQAIRHHLAEAAEHLREPGAATRELDEARALYRSFVDFIQQADPTGFHDVGLAWLELASSIGHAGVVAVGAKPADEVAFAAARAALGSYLIANYEPDAFAERTGYAPIPEQQFQANPEREVTAWLPPGSDLNDQDPLPRLVLNFEEQGIDERDLFLAAFGDMLFDSPEIFGEPARSLGLACSTCHNRSDINQRLFIPGITPRPGVIDVDGSFFNSLFNDHRDDPIDIPSLRGIRFTGPYGRDGRFASLRDFTRNVIVNEFAGPEPSPLVLDALVAYMLEFDFLPAPYLNFDGTLNELAPPAALRGETLFQRPFAQMGNRSCASCHLPDSHFTDNRVHNIGSAQDGYSAGLSGAFDTPTLLGANYTAPYFHDGSLETLADVVAWFDQRFALGLSADERADLTAYLEVVGTGDQPYEAFDGERTPFRLMVEELSVFLSTLDTLIPARDQLAADLVLRTVAADIAADASVMTNRAALEKTHELADLLWQLRDAIAAAEWDEAERRWLAYQELERQYDPELR
jgi:cytochrome c peroxidase